LGYQLKLVTTLTWLLSVSGVLEPVGDTITFCTLQSAPGSAVVQSLTITFSVGDRGLAAEFGHVTVIPDGPLCPCGQRGHLEAIASGTAIERFVSEKIELGYPSVLSSIKHLTASDVSKAALNNDQLAVRAMNRAGTYIGYAIADFLHLFNPSIVILGGGVARSGSLLIEPIIAALPERIMDRGYIDRLLITTATLGDEAGLMGGLAYARDVPDS